MDFTIYDDSLGSTLLWSETHPSVDVRSGLFRVLLGSTAPIDGDVLDGSVRWLGLQIDGGPPADTLVPIVSAAYAVRAGRSDTADYALSAPGGSGHWSVVDSVLQTVSNWGLARGEAFNALYGEGTYTTVSYTHLRAHET